ncbi:MAG: 50S ribosomal protein L35ae [Candidatus Lokiarchaeota archaeon]|nr:50S ribosomal protein L35ae [Candidatus Lokiarchaeota archaeon]
MKKNALTDLEGIFVNYRRSRHKQHLKHSILKFPGYDTRKAAFMLIGRTVAWDTPSGKTLKGKITRVHGKNGQVVALFKKAGLPGQALGQHIYVVK